MPPPTRDDVEAALRELDRPGARREVQTIRLWLIEQGRPSRRQDVARNLGWEDDARTAELRAEVAVLKEQIGAGIREVATVMVERDTWLERCRKARNERNECGDAATALRADVAALKADNAALLDGLTKANDPHRLGACAVAHCLCGHSGLVSRPHPGAALLERMKRLEAFVETHGHRVGERLCPHTGGYACDPGCNAFGLMSRPGDERMKRLEAVVQRAAICGERGLREMALGALK